MDHAVYPIAKVVAAFARAITLNPDREAALRAAAQDLGITEEAVRDALSEVGEEVP